MLGLSRNYVDMTEFANICINAETSLFTDSSGKKAVQAHREINIRPRGREGKEKRHGHSQNVNRKPPDLNSYSITHPTGFPPTAKSDTTISLIGGKPRPHAPRNHFTKGYPSG